MVTHCRVTLLTEADPGQSSCPALRPKAAGQDSQLSQLSVLARERIYI